MTNPNCLKCGKEICEGHTSVLPFGMTTQDIINAAKASNRDQRAMMEKYRELPKVDKKDVSREESQCEDAQPPLRCKCLDDFNCLCDLRYGCQHCRPQPPQEDWEETMGNVVHDIQILLESGKIAARNGLMAFVDDQIHLAEQRGRREGLERAYVLCFNTYLPRDCKEAIEKGIKKL